MTAALAVVLAVLFAVLGAAKILAVPAMRTAAVHLGHTIRQYRAIGALELLGATGVVIGLHVRWIGTAAAIGLVLLMLGAVREHAAHRDGVARITLPLAVAALALSYLTALV